jgi:hypothetical protein
MMTEKGNKRIDPARLANEDDQLGLREICLDKCGKIGKGSRSN